MRGARLTPLAPFALAGAMLGAPSRAHASEAPEASGARDAAETREPREARIASVQRTLDDDEPAAMRWWALWSIGFAAGAVGNGVASFAFAPGPERESARVQTVTSGIALVSTLLIPMPSTRAGSRLRAAAGSPEERAAEAERLFAASAEAEGFGASWLTHAGAVVVNGAAGAWLAWHERYPRYGLLAFVTGELVAELKIWTMPRGALQAQQARAPSVVAWTAAVAPIPGGTWVGVGAIF